MSASQLPFLIEPMRLTDIPEVVAVEKASYTMTWPQKAYEYELTQNNLAHYCVLRLLTERLASLSGQAGPSRPVIGLAGFWLMADEAHINTIAVLPRWRRLGLGEWLLIDLLYRAINLGASVATLEVRPSNQPALALYDKYRFKEAGRRLRYYTDNHEDALILTTPPLTAPDYQSMLTQRRTALFYRLVNTPLTVIAQIAGQAES